MVRRAPLGALPVEPHEALGAERDGRRLRFPQATRMRAPVTEWLLLDGLRSGILLSVSSCLAVSTPNFAMEAPF